VGEQLQLDLIQTAEGIAGLDVDDAELVADEFLVVVRVLDLDRRDRPGQVRAKHRVQKMDQQAAVALGPEQGLEDTVDLGIDSMAHAMSLVSILLLADHPGLGPARPDIAPDLRYFPVRRYLILYRQITDGIELVRVVHGARDVPTLMADT
jgi:hypothetical protein